MQRSLWINGSLIQLGDIIAENVSKDFAEKNRLKNRMKIVAFWKMLPNTGRPANNDRSRFDGSGFCDN